MVILTATLLQYANGNFFLQAQGSNISEIAGSLNTFGVFAAPIQSNLTYGITILPAPGSSYSRFGATFLSNVQGLQDITDILDATIPPPVSLGISLETNGTQNPVQNVLNLKDGTNITFTSDDDGGVQANVENGGGNVTTNPTATQAIVQPNGTGFAVEVDDGDPQGTFIEVINHSIIGSANQIAVFASVDASGNAGNIQLEAIASDASGSVVQISGSVALFQGIGSENYTAINSDVTIDYTFGSSVIIVDASQNDVTVSIPNTLNILGEDVDATGVEFVIIRDDATPSGKNLIVLPTPPSTIQGESSISIPDKSCITIICNSSSSIFVWEIQTDNRPATTSSRGNVKPDGSSLTVTADGTISGNGYTVVISTAPLTPSGATGSMTFTKGILVASTPAT